MLVKTSNPGSGELQDIVAGDRLVYQVMGDLNERVAAGTEGKYGYTIAGAVTGATYPSDIRALRKRLGKTFFLVPGYGAQGAPPPMSSTPSTNTATGPLSTPPGASCAPGRRPGATAMTSPRPPGPPPFPCGTISSST